MSATDLAAVIVTIVCLAVVVVLVLAVQALVRTLRELRRTVDELRAALLSLHESSDDSSPAAGGVLMRLPGATDDWSLPDDLWLNSCPYRRSIRDMFYTDVVECLQRSVADPDCPRLMRVVVTPPELNMEMDSYRVGTLLVRARPTLISHRLLLSLSLSLSL